MLAKLRHRLENGLQIGKKAALPAAAAVAAALLAGCASTMNYMEMKALMPPLASDKGRIYFYRPDSWRGGLITPDISVNQEVVGTSEVGGFFFVDRPAGSYDISCGKESVSDTGVTVAAGQEVYVRTVLGPGVVVARVIPQPVDAMTAIPEIRNLRYMPTRPAS